MTPTMSEYFEAWKNSRFVAGDKANEKAFVAASRLQDIADILGGLVPGLRQRRAADRQGRRATRPSRPAATSSGLHAVRRSGCATRRPAASSSPPTRPTRSAPRRRTAPRRSPARSRRRPASSTSSWRPSARVPRLRRPLVAARRSRRLALACGAAAPAAAHGDAPWRAAGDVRDGAVRRADGADPRHAGDRRAAVARGERGATAASCGRGIRGGRAGRRRGGPARARATPSARRRRDDGRRSRPPAARSARRCSAASFAVTLAAVGRGDVDARARVAAAARVPHRDALHPPGRDATRRAARPAGEADEPGRRAREAVAKDLLDAYQARLRELLDDADAAAERGLPARLGRGGRAGRRATGRSSPPRYVAGPRRRTPPTRPRRTSPRWPRGRRRRRHGRLSPPPATASPRRSTASPPRRFTADGGGPPRPAAAALPRARPGRVRPRRQGRPGHARLRDPGGGRVPHRRRRRASPTCESQLAKRDPARTDGDRRTRSTELGAARRRGDAQKTEGVRPSEDVEALTRADRGRPRRRRCRRSGRSRPTSPTTT